MPAALRGEEPNAKAARLLEPLSKRPGAAALFERFVNAWLDTGTLDSLSEYLTKRAAADPSPANRLLLAQFHTRQGQPVKALEQFRAALASDAGNAETWLLKGQMEAKMLDFTAAIESLKKCLAANPPGELAARAAQLLGRAQARAGQTGAALETWSALMKSRPADEDLREDILEMQIAESIWPAALENAAHLVEQTADPYKRVLRRMRLGDVQDRSGQRDKSLETFAVCLEDAGAGSWLEKEILAQIDKLFRREDDLSGLREFLEKQAAAAPQRAGVQRALAKLLMETGEADAALAAAKQLMDLTPGDRSAREEFIAMLTGAGRAAEAIPQVQQLIQASPNDAELRLVLADLHHAVKDSAAALAAVREFEKLAAADAGTPVRAAALLDKHGLTAEAVKTLEAVLARDATRVELRLLLASLRHKSGEKAAAIDEWNAIAAAGDLPTALQAVRAMQAAGEAEAAWPLLMQLVPRGKGEALFLTQLAHFADTEVRAIEALPAVRSLVDMAKSAPDLDAALEAVLRMARKANAVPALTAELRAAAATAQQFCLLAVLLETERDTTGAAAALEKAKALSAGLALAQSVRLRTLRGDFAGAALAAEEMFRSTPSVAVAESLTSLHRRAGNVSAALLWVEEWRKLAPGSAAPALEEASLLQSAGREAEAIAALRSAAGRLEQNTDIRDRLAAAYAAAGQSAEAMRLYAALYEEANDLTAKMRWLQPWAETARAAGQLEELIAQFEDRRRDNRASTAPLMALAELHRMANNYEERRKALTEARRLKPGDTDIILEIARLEEREGRRAEAINTLREALPKDTGGKLTQALSEMLIVEGESDEGLALLSERAVTPQQVEAVLESLMRAGNQAGALRFLKPFLDRWPEEWRLRYRAAQLLHSNGDSEQAVKLCLGLLTPPPSTTGTAAAGAPAAQGFSEFLIALLPPDAARLLKMLRLQEYQRSRRLPGGGAGLSRMPAGVAAEEVPLLAAPFIAGKVDDLPKEAAAEAVQQLKRHGLSAALLLKTIGDTSDLIPRSSGSGLVSALKDYPDDRSVLVYATLTNIYDNWGLSPDEKLAQQAWEALHREAPEASLFFALPAAAAARPENAWAAARLAEAEARPAATPLLMMAVLRAAGFDYQSAPPARDRMVSLLMRWRAAGQVNVRGFVETIAGSVFTQLSRDFLRTKNLPALRDLLESEWRSGAPPVTVAGRRAGSLVQPLGFPPAGLAGVPAAVSEFLTEDGIPSVAAELAELVQEPALRLLLLGKSLTSEPADGASALIAAQPGEAMPLLLAAALAEKRGDFAAAGDFAVKAQYLPMDAVMRRRLDGAVAWWAQRQAAPGTALHNAGRDAVLRLRRDASDADDRTELATIMDRLGLTAEADRLMQQGRAALAGGSGTPLERAEKLLRDGRSKDALPVLLQQMRGWAHRWMTTGENFYDEEELQDWRTLAQTSGLMPEIVRAFQPENPAPRQLAEYAALCDLTLRWPEALRAAQQAANAPGSSREVRWRCLNLQLLAEPKNAAQHVLASGLEWDEQLLNACQETLIENSTLENAVRFGRMVDGMLKAAPERAGQGFPVRGVLDAIGTSTTSGHFYSVPNIHLKNPPEIISPLPVAMPAGETARVMALMKERAALYESTGRTLLTRPGCGLDAWDRLRHVVEPETILSEGMAAAAEPLVETGRREGFDVQEFTRIVREVAVAAVKAGRTTEFEKLVRQPWLAGDFAGAAEAAMGTWELYAADDAELLKLSRELVAADRHGWAMTGSLLGVRDVLRELAPQFLKAVSMADNDSMAPEAASLWAPWFAKWNGSPAARELMRAAFGELMRRERIKAEDAGEDEDSRPGELAMLAKAFSDKPELFEPLLAVLKADVFPGLTATQRERIASNINEDALTNELEAAVRSGDFTRLKSCLDLLQLNGGPAELWLTGGVVFQPADRLMALAEKEKAALGFGGPAGKPGFGWQLMEAMSDKRMDFWGMLAPWQQEIAALPEAQREHLEQLLRDYGDGYAVQTETAEKFRRWVFRGVAATEQTELGDLMKEFLSDAASGEMEDADTLQSQLSGLVETALFNTPQQMRGVLETACGIAEKFAAIDALAAVSSSFTESIEDADVDSAQAAWRVGLAAEAVQRGMHDRYLFSYRLEQAGRKLMQGADDSLEGRLAKFVQLTAPQPAPPARIWLLGSQLRVAGEGTGLTDEETLARALRWVEAHRAENAALMAGMETSLLMLRDAGPWTGSAAAAETDLPPGLQQLLALLRSEETPVGVRLHAGVNFLDHFGSTMPKLPPDECARLLLRAHREKLPVHRDAESSVCVALAKLPDELRDAALVKELLPHLQIARPREEITDYSILAGMNALLDLALPLGEAAVVDRMLEAEGYFPNSTTLGVLARRGEKARLAALMAAHPGLQRRDAGWGMNTDALLQTQIPAVAAEIASADARTEVLALFASLTDPADVSALRPQPERIAAFTPQFAGHAWKSAAAKDWALSRLVQSGVPAVLLPLLDETAQRVPLVSAAGFQESDEHAESAVGVYSVLHAARLERALTQGDIQPLKESLEALDSNPLCGAGWRNQVAAHLWSSARSSILRNWPALKPEQRKALCDGWRGMLEPAPADPSLRPDAAWRTGFLLHLLAGQEAAWRNWLESGTDTQRAAAMHSLQTDGDLPEELQIPQDFGGSMEEKLRAQAGVFIHYARHAAFYELPPLDALYFEWTYGSREEFLCMEPALTAALPEDSWVSFAFARCFARLDCWPEVLTRTENALASLSPSADTAWLPLAELHLQALDKAGRGQERADWLAKCRTAAEPKSLDPRSRIIRGAYYRLVAGGK